jgi:hypothetical protein
MAAATTWLKPGMRVITADGEELGHVKEVGATSFKVDAPLALDYWLSLDCVVERDLEEAVTVFVREALEDKIVEPPDDVLLV